MANDTRNAADLLAAANYASTIALAFETHGLDMEGWLDLHSELTGLEVEWLYNRPTIQTTGIEGPLGALACAKYLKIIRQSVEIVEDIFDAAMMKSATHTRAALAAR